MKLLGAEEEDLLEGEGEVVGDFREGEGGGIAAEEEIQDELLAGGDAGDQVAAVARKMHGDGVVRGSGTVGEGCERRTRHCNRAHRRGRRNRRNEVETGLNRLAALPRQKEIADLASIILRTRRDLVTAHNHCLDHRPDPGHRLLHRQFFVPFVFGRTHPPDDVLLCW